MDREILALCEAMGASENREELMLPLVQAVRELLAARLKEGTRPEDCGPVFPLAAAMVVMERLNGLTGGGSTGGVSSFTAGDLTIRRESSGNPGAKSLTEQAQGLLSPWLRDSGFAFRGVEG